MTSKAEQRRRKRNRTISLAGGDVAEAPMSPHMAAREPAEDPRRVAQLARGRVLGYPDTKDAKQAVLSAQRGSQAGCCIDASPHDTAELWQVWQDISAAQRNYRMRILSTTGDPKCASIAMIPDAMQTDTSTFVDIRTPEERNEAAKRAWDMWTARIKALPTPQMIWAIRGAMDGGIDGMGGELWRNGAPTERGVAFVAGLVVLGGQG